VTYEEVLEEFAAAQKLGRKRYPGLHQTTPKGAGIRVREPLPEPDRYELPGLYLVEMTSQLSAGYRRIVDITVPPLRTQVQQRCACGGYWELREGTSRLQHVGRARAGCRAGVNAGTRLEAYVRGHERGVLGGAAGDRGEAVVSAPLDGVDDGGGDLLDIGAWPEDGKDEG
jgi:hypothetical protein